MEGDEGRCPQRKGLLYRVDLIPSALSRRLVSKWTDQLIGKLWTEDLKMTGAQWLGQAVYVQIRHDLGLTLH